MVDYSKKEWCDHGDTVSIKVGREYHVGCRWCGCDLTKEKRQRPLTKEEAVKIRGWMNQGDGPHFIVKHDQRGWYVKDTTYGEEIHTWGEYEYGARE